MNMFGFLLLLTFWLYNASLGYYTAYGFFKSYTEYFCTQRRPGVVDSVYYTNTLLTLNATIPSLKNETPEYFVFSKNETCRLKTNNVPYNGTGVDGDEYLYKVTEKACNSSLSKSYKLGENYFDLLCYQAEDKITEYNTSSKLISVSMTDDGYFNERGGVDNYKKITFNPMSEKYMQCRLYHRLETCSLKVETTNSFFLFYLIFMSSITLFFLVSYTGAFRDLIRRKILLIYNKFEMCSFLEFCNPIDSKPYYYSVGDEIVTMGFLGDKVLSEYKLDSFTDLEGEYLIKENWVLIITKTERCCIEIPEESIDNLKSYFFVSKLDPRKCVVDPKCDHFLKTIDVIKRVGAGELIVNSRCIKNDFALNVMLSDLNLLKMGCDFDVDFLKNILCHNFLFFKQQRVDCIMNCFKNKTSNLNRPIRVNNSSWKLYTSDFKILLKKFYPNVKMFSQCKWKPSKALVRIQEIDLGVLEIVDDMEDTYQFNNKNNINISHLEKYRIGYTLPSAKFQAYPGFNVKIESEFHQLKSFLVTDKNKDLEGVKKSLLKTLEMKKANMDYNSEAVRTYKQVLSEIPESESVKIATRKNEVKNLIEDSRKMKSKDSNVKELKKEYKILEGRMKEVKPDNSRYDLKRHIEDQVKEIMSDIKNYIYLKNYYELLDGYKEDEVEVKVVTKKMKEIIDVVTEETKNLYSKKPQFLKMKKKTDKIREKKRKKKGRGSGKGRNFESVKLYVKSETEIPKSFLGRSLSVSVKAATLINNVDSKIVNKLDKNEIDIRRKPSYMIYHSLMRMENKMKNGFGKFKGGLEIDQDDYSKKITSESYNRTSEMERACKGNWIELAINMKIIDFDIN